MTEKLKLKTGKVGKGKHIDFRIEAHNLEKLDKLVEQVPYSRNELLNILVAYALENVDLE